MVGTMQYLGCVIDFLEQGERVVIKGKDIVAQLERQKPAEWSREDEDMLQSLILFIDTYNYFAGKDARVVIKWLKSLRPSWKPSEEQMEALERASTNKYLSAKQYDILVSLYKQLKKLKEGRL